MAIQKEEMDRARYVGRCVVLSRPVQGHHSPSTSVCLPTQLSKPHSSEIFMGASSHRHDQSLTPFSALPLSQEKRGGGGTENPKLLIIAWSFQLLAHIQDATQTHLIITKDRTITPQIISVSGALHQE